MNKQIFILNGTAGAGKDTFAGLLNEYIPTKHISSITPIKQASKVFGWSGEKTPEYRNFLCEFKKFLNKQGEFIWNYLDKSVEAFMSNKENLVLLIYIREPEEIKRDVNRYKAKTIFISNSRAPSSAAQTNYNESDLNVGRYSYYYTIKNDGTVNDFRANIKAFAEHISSSCRCDCCIRRNKETSGLFEDLLSIITNLLEERKDTIQTLLHSLLSEESK